MFSSLQDKLPTLIKQQVNSCTGSNTDLVALRLSRPQEQTIKLPNPTDPSKPKIVFPYSEQAHLDLEPGKENKNKNKREYLRRAITAGTTPLSDEELLNFLEVVRNAMFGVITVQNNTSEDNSSHLLSYFVYIKSGLRESDPGII